MKGSGCCKPAFGRGFPGETIGEQEVRYVMGQIDDGKEEELADLGERRNLYYLTVPL